MPTLVIARWNGELDRERLRAVLDDPSLMEPDMELHHGSGPEEETAEGPHSVVPGEGAAEGDGAPQPASRS